MYVFDGNTKIVASLSYQMLSTDGTRLDVHSLDATVEMEQNRGAPVFVEKC